ncbi:MAG: protein kinase [Planctomycetes bacterium]|nr:protein kinase [Planctomycetota bacterium]
MKPPHDTTSDDESDDEQDAATRIFDTWISREAHTNHAELERLCEAHPEHAKVLRRSWKHYQVARQLIEDLGPARASDDLVQAIRSLALAPTRFTPERTIGRGGMCTVEEITEGRLGRRLARKSLPISLRETRLSGHELRRLARFVLEARIGSRLRHPSIPQVFEFGLDDQDRPFLVLPLVDGVSFAEIIRRYHDGDTAWRLTRVLSVVMTVCSAISHAHSVGILHRDLKPENIMVGRFGETMVLDWGLAKRIGDIETGPIDDLDEMLDESRTIDGDVVGTPAFMAPEHARGDSILDPASDQYQIGALLYALLAGKRPFEDMPEATNARTIVEAVASSAPTPLSTLASQAPPELVAITEKAMARNPTDRYASVEDLAMDVRAFLEQRVVRAHDTGALATSRKWILRNRGVSIAAASLIAVVIGGLSTILLLQTSWSKKLTTANAELRDALAGSSRRLDALERENYVNAIQSVQVGMRAGQRRSELVALLDSLPERLRGIEWSWLHRQTDTSAARVADCGKWFLAVAPDQEHFATCTESGVAKLWKITPMSLVTERAVPLRIGGPSVFRPDGNELLFLAHDRMTRVRMPSLETIREFVIDGVNLRAACYSSDGRRVFLAGRMNFALVVDAENGTEIARLPLRDGLENIVAIDHSRERLAVASWTGSVRIFDTKTYALVHELSRPTWRGAPVQFATDGTLHVMSAHAAIHRFDLDEKRPLAMIQVGQGEDVHYRQAVDPTGRLHIRAIGASAFLTDLTTNRVVGIGVGHDAAIGPIHFVPDRHGVLTLAVDGEVRFWHEHKGQMMRRIPVGSEVSSIAATKDFHTVYAAILSRGIGIFDFGAIDDGTTPAIRWIPMSARRHNSLALSPDETTLAVRNGADFRVSLVHLPGGNVERLERGPVSAIAWHDQSLLVTERGTNSVAAYGRDGRRRWTLSPGFEASSIAVHNDTIAVAGPARDVGAWALRENGDGTPGLEQLWRTVASEPPASIAFSGDGMLLSCALRSGRVELRRSSDGDVSSIMVGHNGHIAGIQWAKDRMITSSADSTLRIWRQQDGRELMRCTPDAAWLSNVLIDSDKHTIIVGSEYGILHAWRF